MDHPVVPPAGEVTPLHSRHRRAELDREHAAIIAKALQENLGRHLDEAKNGHHREPVDALALRGIPAVGRGAAGGAMRGTRPDVVVIANLDVRRGR